MTWAYEVKYKHTGIRNQYKVYDNGALIGDIRWTPIGVGTWTFTSVKGDAETYGSTRLQAVGYYVEQFMKRGEGNND